jgi:3-dehydroquinate synthase
VVRYAYEKLTDVEFSPTDILFALGGGGVMDVAAFVAATYQKGIPFIQVPTSLLAMVDSAISQDAYLNFQSRKNQIGVTYSPEHVVIDTDYLKTMPSKVLANGVAQAIQYGLLVDVALLSDLFTQPMDITSLISKCLLAKKSILSDNPILLSFGQEIAEAIEGHFRFMKYSHGEALALGMYGMFPSPNLRTLYDRHGLPYLLTGVSKDSLLKRIRKKYEIKQHAVSLVRLERAGKPVVEMIPAQELSGLYDAFISNICLP